MKACGALGDIFLALRYSTIGGTQLVVSGMSHESKRADMMADMVEHYADGDLINEDTPIGYGPAVNESLAVWGPEVPKEFLD